MEIEPIVDGLQVSGIGMGMTAAVLIILAISVQGMAWFDAYLRRRESERTNLAQTEPRSSTEPAVEIPEPQSDGATRAAAIAVAIALARRASQTANAQQSPSADVGATNPYDSWLTEGRARQRAKQGFTQGSTGWR